MDLADQAPGLSGYFLLGIEHLLLGVDHILFVVGLVLFIRSPWMLVKAITAFTIAMGGIAAFWTIDRVVALV